MYVNAVMGSLGKSCGVPESPSVLNPTVAVVKAASGKTAKATKKKKR